MAHETEMRSWWRRDWSLPLSLVAVFLIMFCLYYCQEAIERERKKHGSYEAELLYMAQGERAKVLSLGQDGLMADLLWIRCMNYTIHHLNKADGDFRYLYPLLNTITELDPYFVKVYVYGSIFLSGISGEDDKAELLLRKGYENIRRLKAQDLPGSWQIPVELGNLYWIRYKSFDKAYIWYKKAVEFPSCPKLYRQLVKIMSGEMGDLARISVRLDLSRTSFMEAVQSKSRPLIAANYRRYTEGLEEALRYVNRELKRDNVSGPRKKRLIYERNFYLEEHSKWTQWKSQNYPNMR